MTERLYYNDSFLREFDAQVISCEQEGERWKVILDRTAFYPTSGGQPHDLGTLGGAPVVDVADAEDKVVHYTTAAVELGPAHGKIDWVRRTDHMQQHTGQHLLSAAFIELFNFSTVSFHLGREACTIDLNAPSLLPRHLDEAERRTNEVIFEDRVVAVRYGTAQELAEAGIRKRVGREGILRAVEVERFDRQPCGGTHLARTGQAGMLLTRKLERRRDSWRLEFVCGFRALSTARGDYATLTQAAALLSCGLPEVPSVLTKMIEERRAQHSALRRLEERLAGHEARSLLAEHPAASPDSPRVIVQVLDEATPEYLRLLAATLVAESKAIVLLASRSSGHVALAQTKGVAAGDMGVILREALREFQGKGGGTKDFSQGSLANPAQAEALLKRAKDLLVF
ncbi:MAG: DHHA1 domain-containing protein [Candidatus Acidiferrales bacterium]